MSYTPTNWKAGDTVTSAKLNKLEQGVAEAGGGSVLHVNMTYNGEDYTLDKTAGEIIEAFQNGIVRLIFKAVDDYETFVNLFFYSRVPNGYIFQFPQLPALSAATADDYPTSQGST